MKRLGLCNLFVISIVLNVGVGIGFLMFSTFIYTNTKEFLGILLLVNIVIGFLTGIYNYSIVDEEEI